MFAIIFEAINVPFTPRAVSVPTLVMFGCALLRTVLAIEALLMLPVSALMVTVPVPLPPVLVIDTLLPATIDDTPASTATY